MATIAPEPAATEVQPEEAKMEVAASKEQTPAVAEEKTEPNAGRFGPGRRRSSVIAHVDLADVHGEAVMKSSSKYALNEVDGKGDAPEDGSKPALGRQSTLAIISSRLGNWFTSAQDTVTGGRKLKNPKSSRNSQRQSVHKANTGVKFDSLMFKIMSFYGILGFCWALCYYVDGYLLMKHHVPRIICFIWFFLITGPNDIYYLFNHDKWGDDPFKIMLFGAFHALQLLAGSVLYAMSGGTAPTAAITMIPALGWFVWIPTVWCCGWKWNVDPWMGFFDHMILFASMIIITQFPTTLAVSVPVVIGMAEFLLLRVATLSFTNYLSNARGQFKQAAQAAGLWESARFGAMVILIKDCLASDWSSATLGPLAFSIVANILLQTLNQTDLNFFLMRKVNWMFPRRYSAVLGCRRPSEWDDVLFQDMNRLYYSCVWATTFTNPCIWSGAVLAWKVMKVPNCCAAGNLGLDVVIDNWHVVLLIYILQEALAELGCRLADRFVRYQWPEGYVGRLSFPKLVVGIYKIQGTHILICILGMQLYMAGMAAFARSGYGVGADWA